MPVGCRRIVAAVDANPEEPEMMPLNERILDAAVAVRDLARAQLDIVHVWSIYGERMVKDYMRTAEFAQLEQSVRAEHEQNLNKLFASRNLDVNSEQIHLIRGEPTIEIPNFVRANNTDLLVMGTVGRQGMAGLLLGNTAEMILSQLPCSVLAVNPPDFVVPERVAASSAPLFPTEMPPVP
jgi:nucleotide-binding universal stress UspA family protein